MLGQSPNQAQTDLFKNLLAKQLNPQHFLYLLAHAIPWKKLEESFAPLYARVLVDKGYRGHGQVGWFSGDDTRKKGPC